MIIAVLSVSLTLLLGTVCSVFAQTNDIDSVLDKAQKSLSKNTEDNIEPTLLQGDYKSYKNVDYNVKMQYPSDWVYYEKIGPVDGSPDQLFSVSFTSPPNKKPFDVVYAWFTIEKLNEKTTTEERKNVLYNNLKKIPEIVQDITQSPTELSGLAAFRTDYFSPGLGQNDIDIETIDNDLLYTLTFTSEPDTLNKHLTSINNMMDTVQITPIDTVSKSSKSTSNSHSTPTNSPRSITPISDEQDNCDSSYPDFCIPPPPPNLNCPDIPQKRFTVSGSDPHGFDRDNDGIGCES